MRRNYRQLHIHTISLSAVGQVNVNWELWVINQSKADNSFAIFCPFSHTLQIQFYTFEGRGGGQWKRQQCYAIDIDLFLSSVWFAEFAMAYIRRWLFSSFQFQRK